MGVVIGISSSNKTKQKKKMEKLGLPQLLTVLPDLKIKK